MPPPPWRPRPVDTATPLCPQTAGADRGGLGLGNLRATGPPQGGPGRQWPCHGGNGSLPEPHRAIWQGTRVTVALRGRGLAGVAEGWGLRATARGVEGAPTPVRHCLGQAAEQRRALPRSWLGAVPVRPLPLDELSAGRRGVKDGAISPEEALNRLERARHWLGTARAPARTRRWTSAPGPRPLALAPRVLPQAPSRGWLRTGGPCCSRRDAGHP